MLYEDRPYHLISLAYKGGNLVTGTELCRKAISKGKAKLVLISWDCSDNTRKLFTDKCSYKGIPLKTFGAKDRLGRAVGKTDTAVVAVLDEGFSREILKHIDA
ncbi:MAG TPA: ribosomal L7Ae/L30e/S12e/Gadd45 family protein [Bacillota bacterium]|nr:ribosomal L7Ae/L30e/S12e/Gadd45 family protein [Bacillota bacterium]